MSGWENTSSVASKPNETVTSPKKSNIQLENELISDFVDHLNYDDFLWIFREITTNSSQNIDTKIINKLEKFKKNKSKYDEITNLNNIGYQYLLRALTNSTQIRLKDNQAKLIDLFTTLYNLDEDKKEVTRLKNRIWELWLLEVESLFHSQTERDKLLRNVLRKKSKQKVKQISKVIEELTTINKKWLTQEQKNSLAIYEYNWYFDEEIINFIKNLSPESKKSFLLTFVPTLTIDELELLWIGSSQIDEIVQNKINSFLESNNTKLSNEQKNVVQQNIVSYINPDFKRNTVILTSDLVGNIGENSSNILWNNIGGINKNVDELLNSERVAKILAEINQEIEAENKKTRIRNRKDFIKKCSSTSIRNIPWYQNLFTPGSIIEWKIHEDYSSKHFYIELCNFDDNSLNVYDRTHDNWIIKTTHWTPTSLNYQELFDIFSKTLLHDGHIHIKTPEEIETQINAWAVKSFEESGEIKNTDELKTVLDSADPEWRDIKLINWMTFEFTWKDSNKVAIWKITKINETWVTIASEWPLTDMTFKEFFDTFTNLKWKRLTNITDYNSVFESIKKHKNGAKFKDLELKKDKLVPKNQEKNEQHPWINLFVNEDNFLEIKKVHWDRIDVIVWKWKEDSKTKSFKADKAEKITLTYEIFYWYITKNKLEPKINQDLIEPVDKINKNKPWKRFSIWNHVFWMQNIITIWMWFKQYVDSIKSTLKENNELQAAQLALALWWILPASMRQDLQNKVEWVQKGKMEAKIKQMMDMNIFLSIDSVEKILKTSNAFEHEIEAALMFVLKKHWWLYPMKLQQYRWSFMWYEKLWWRVGDKMFKEYMKDMINDNREPTEEWLISKLFVKQSDQSDKDYYPKRRSTIVWDFMWSYSGGREDSMSVWEKEWKTLATLGWRKNTTIWKLKEWRHMFALWCFKTVLDKWWNPKEKNHIPFLILLSWLPKRLHQSTNGTLKWLWISHQLPSLFFCQNPALVDTFEKIMLKFAKQISTDCERELAWITNNRDSWNKNESETIGALDKFWDKYGWELWPKLNTVDDNAYLSSKEDNDVKQYFDVAKVIADNNNKSKDNFENDVYKHDNSLMLYAWWSKYFGSMVWWIQSSWSLRDWLPASVFDNFVTKLEKIRDYKAPWKEKNSKESEEWREKLFIALNRIAAIYTKEHFSGWRIMQSDQYKKLYKMWLWLPNKDNYSLYSSEEMESSNFDKHYLSCYNSFKNKTRENEIVKKKSETAMKIKNILELPNIKNNNKNNRKLQSWIPIEYLEDEDEWTFWSVMWF